MKAGDYVITTERCVEPGPGWVGRVIMRATGHLNGGTLVVEFARDPEHWLQSGRVWHLFGDAVRVLSELEALAYYGDLALLFTNTTGSVTSGSIADTPTYLTPQIGARSGRQAGTATAPFLHGECTGSGESSQPAAAAREGSPWSRHPPLEE